MGCGTSANLAPPPAGARSSRDIAQVNRTPVIMMTSPQAKIASTTINSSRVATAEPSVVDDVGDRRAGLGQRDGIAGGERRRR